MEASIQLHARAPTSMGNTPDYPLNRRLGELKIGIDASRRQKSLLLPVAACIIAHIPNNF
jgi:hypothetical protein